MQVNWLKTLKRIRSPAVLVLVLALLCRITTLFFVQRTWAYSSDDVSWQTILFTWTPLNGHVAYLGVKDNFITNMPFLALLSLLLRPGRTELFIESALFTSINFILFYTAGLYFLRKCRVKISYVSLLPFLWLAIVGKSFGQLFLNTNWRDFEAGVAFVYLMLVAKAYYGEVRPLKSTPSRLLISVTVVIAGVFVYSDPYFFYFTLLPIIVFFAVLGYRSEARRRRALMISFFGLSSIAVAQIITYLVLVMGIRMPPGEGLGLAGPRVVLHNIRLAGSSLLTIFGAGLPKAHDAIVVDLARTCNLIVVGFVIYLLVISIFGVRKKLDERSIWSGFLALLCLWVLAAYVVSNAVVDTESYRYLLILIFAAMLLVALQAPRLGRVRSFFYLFLVATVVLKLVTSYIGNIPVTGAEDPNAANYTLIQKVKGLGLQKGYGNYWDADINTYFSDNEVQFLPVSCVNGRTVPLYLLVDSAEFYRPATWSFMVIDPDTAGPSICTKQQILKQFGNPKEVVPLSPKTILVYDHDILRNMISKSN